MESYFIAIIFSAIGLSVIGLFILTIYLVFEMCINDSILAITVFICLLFILMFAYKIEQMQWFNDLLHSSAKQQWIKQ